MANYQGIAREQRFSAASMESALDSKVSLSGDETIYGTKTFATSPLVPSKNTAAGNNPRTIATEAQVYECENSIKEKIKEIISAHKTNVDNLLSDKVSLTGDETIEGTKTFIISPVVPIKDTTAGENPTAIATEAQIVKTVNDKLSSDQTIDGGWTFAVSPAVPSKDTVAGRTNSTAIATEAQVYRTLMCW
jgi:hypothetical protein